MGGSDKRIRKLKWKEREEGTDRHKEHEKGRAHTKETLLNPMCTVELEVWINVTQLCVLVALRTTVEKHQN